MSSNNNKRAPTAIAAMTPLDSFSTLPVEWAISGVSAKRQVKCMDWFYFKEPIW